MIGTVIVSLSLIALLARQSIDLLPDTLAAEAPGSLPEVTQPRRPPQRLLLVGGGKRPMEALEHWIDWAKKPDRAVKVLILAWASEKPKVAADSLSKDLKAAGAEAVLISVAPPESELEVSYFLRQMDEADAVFFSGGVQSRILRALKNPHVATRLRNAYWKQGIPFAGTSAGTAVMSKNVILGGGPQADGYEDLDEVKSTLGMKHSALPLQLGEGLGFLPGTVTDQHFVIRERTPRLKQALLEAQKSSVMPLVGVGVEEDCAILFEREADSSKFRGIALGPRHSLILTPLFGTSGSSAPQYRQTPLNPGESTEIAFDPLTHRDCGDLLEMKIVR